MSENSEAEPSYRTTAGREKFEPSTRLIHPNAEGRDSIVDNVA